MCPECGSNVVVSGMRDCEVTCHECDTELRFNHKENDLRPLTHRTVAFVIAAIALVVLIGLFAFFIYRKLHPHSE